MKLELELSDELSKRIAHGASLFNVTAGEYVLRLLEQNAQHVPDPEGAERRIAAIRASASPEDDYDMDEFLRALDENRGRRPLTTGNNGAAR